MHHMFCFVVGTRGSLGTFRRRPRKNTRVVTVAEGDKYETKLIAWLNITYFSCADSFI